MPTDTAHPTADTLAAFGLGKLDGPTSETIAGHLETCPDCRRRVTDLSADSFVRGVRAGGGPHSTPTPSKPLDGLADGIARTIPPAGSAPPPADAPSGLTDHPQYEIVRELGRGGMGVVYLARHRLMNRDEVLKVVTKALVGHPGAMDRFLREIEAAAKLSHPNVVKAHNAFPAGDLLVLVMEFVPGEDLGRVARDRGPLPVTEACDYACQAALGLQHAHESGMVHRDVKPGNLILTRDGGRAVVKVLDFGLAKARSENRDDPGLTGAGVTLGTPAYMAPEQARDAATADIRADVYALGCTLYHLLAGRPPFQGDSVYDVLCRHQQETAEPLDRVRPAVPAGLAAVVGRMMAKDPADRFPTPKAVADALAPFARPSGDGSTVAWGPGAGLVPPRRRSRWVLPLAAGVIALGLIGAWAAGVFKVKTPDGVLVVEVTEPGAEVTIDGRVVTVVGADGQPVEITVPPGTHRVEAKKPGFVVFGEEVRLERGGKRTITARLELVAKPPAPPPPPPPADGFVPLFNGKDLTGWTDRSGPRNDWLVGPRGNLKGDSNKVRPGHPLVTDRADYRDFHLRVETAVGEAASILFGVPEARRPERGYMVRTGPVAAGESDLGNLTFGPNVLKKARPVPVQPREWVWVEVIVRGRAVTVRVKGVPVNEYQIDAPVTGRVGLGRHPEAVMLVRAVEIKELPAATPPAPPTPPPPKPKPKPVVSRFAPGDDEGWTTRDENGDRTATRDFRVAPAPGRRNAWLFARDNPDGKEWGFHAPKAFHGDHADLYGSHLEFKVRASRVDFARRSEARVVQITSGATHLHVRYSDLAAPVVPGEWATVRIKLDPTGSWRLPHGKPAGERPIRQVLGAITDLRILGEYADGEDSCCLDDVILGAE